MIFCVLILVIRIFSCMYIDQKDQKNNLLRWGIALKIIIYENFLAIINNWFYKKNFAFLHLHKKKKVLFLHMFL